MDASASFAHTHFLFSLCPRYAACRFLCLPPFAFLVPFHAFSLNSYSACIACSRCWGLLTVFAASTAAVLLQAGSTPASKVRGAFLGLGALLLVLLLDEPTPGHVSMHVEGETGGGMHQDYHTVTHNKYFTAALVSDQTAGGLALLLAACLRLGSSHLSRTLAVDLAGAKRVQALMYLAAAVFLAPVAWYNHSPEAVGEGTTVPSSSLYLLVCGTEMRVVK